MWFVESGRSSLLDQEVVVLSEVKYSMSQKSEGNTYVLLVIGSGATGDGVGLHA